MTPPAIRNVPIWTFCPVLDFPLYGVKYFGFLLNHSKPTPRINYKITEYSEFEGTLQDD